MKSNRLLKWLVLPLVVLVVGVKLFGGRDRSDDVSYDGPRLTPEEMKALGIEGDTPRDTVATLVGQVKQLRTELQATLSDNKQQKDENERLRQRETAIEQRIQGAFDAERLRLQEEREVLKSEKSQTTGLLQDMQQRLDGLTGGSTGQADIPVGLDLENSDGKSFSGGMRWVEPDDAHPVEGAAGRGAGSKASSFPTSFGPAQTALEQPGETIRHQDRDLNQASRLKPVYTVPSNSTLMGSIAMTALIGRVPVDGTVNDPFPFKVLIGPDNLTANGIDLPDVSGAVVSGTASGDWTLSCVRGNIRSITFVFRDGTVRTEPGTAGMTATRKTVVTRRALAASPPTAVSAGSAIHTASRVSAASGAATPSNT